MPMKIYIIRVIYLEIINQNLIMLFKKHNQILHLVFQLKDNYKVDYMVQLNLLQLIVL